MVGEIRHAFAAHPAAIEGRTVEQLGGTGVSLRHREGPARASIDGAVPAHIFFSSAAFTCISWSQTTPGLVPMASKPAVTPQ